MALKVTFPANTTSITVGGLYQWDYGRVLEIECAEFGSEIMEVHFACHNMTEAVVRPCTFANGVGTVTIPDRCLEQSGNITAWIYKIVGSQGHTVKTIILPVVARTRPSKSQDIPAEYIDKYAEALTEINEAVDALEKGNITISNAIHANTADSAETAKSASNATYATSAGSATTAGSANTASNATYATSAGSANTAKSAESADLLNFSIDNRYCRIFLSNGLGNTSKKFDQGFYLIIYETSGITLSGIGYIGKNNGAGDEYCVPVGKMALLYCESESGADVNLVYSDGDSTPAIQTNGILDFFKMT